VINKSHKVYFFLFVFIIIGFTAIKFFNLQVLDFAAYNFMFIGIYIFYLSYLKQYKTGIAIGVSVFLIGSFLFVMSKYELLNLGRIFVPAALMILGAGVLIANILSKTNFLSVLFSVLSLIGGAWLIVNRGDININLFLAAGYSIVKNYWLVLVGSAGIIFLVTKNFKNRD
jgi:hypothetical protein